MLKRIIREPLLHFGLLALLIFAAYAVVSPEEIVRDDTAIMVTAPKIGHLGAVFARTWQRPPSAEELAGLVNDYVTEEILVREALALGLETGDTVIRRRLRQKMEFLNDAEMGNLTATDAELATYLEAHPDKYLVAPKIAFEQVFLSPERRGDKVSDDARVMLVSLSEHPGTDPASVTDASLLPTNLDLTAPAEISTLFGPDFAAALADAPPDVWIGPVASVYGVHLLRVKTRQEGRLPPLDEVRAEVLRDWTSDRKAALRSAQLAALKGKYQVTIEAPPPPGDTP